LVLELLREVGLSLNERGDSAVGFLPGCSFGFEFGPNRITVSFDHPRLNRGANGVAIAATTPPRHKHDDRANDSANEHSDDQ
jgi:hypothetical protein